MLIDMNMVHSMIADFNKELFYKMSEIRELAGIPEDYDFLVLVTNGEHITIKFLGVEIFNSQNVKRFDNLTVEKEIAFGERENFEQHIRLLIQDELNVLEKVTMI